jgi:hypothetical protein
MYCKESVFTPEIYRRETDPNRYGSENSYCKSRARGERALDEMASDTVFLSLLFCRINVFHSNLVAKITNMFMWL